MTLVDRLRAVPTANAKVLLRELGVTRVVMRGLLRLSGDGVVAGPVRTLRFLPAREDVTPPKGNIQRATIDTLRRGEVLVIDAHGSPDGAVLGDMLAARAHANGAAAVIADGVVRDIAGIRTMGLTIHARGTQPEPSVRNLVSCETGAPIACGGVLVEPGDYIIADDDAVLVVPKVHAEEIARRGAEMAERDEFSQALIAAGWAIDEAYPLPEARLAAFERYKRDRTVPSPAR
jgi:regulator of RNase E activity RraA